MATHARRVKRLALRATDEYNSSTGHYADFVGTMIRAWLYLLHAKFERDKLDYTYKNPDGSPKLQDGEPKSWELATCVQKHFPTDNDPVRQNIELFIALRNKVEHRYEHGLSEAVGGRAHALVINYQNELVSIFGEAHSLADKLRFPIFLDSLGSPVAAQAVRDTRAVKAARRIVARYDAGLAGSVKDDNRYDYRVTLVQSANSKAQAFEFVKMSDLSAESQAELIKLGKVGKVVTKIKKVDVAGDGLMLPKAVLDKVNAALPYNLKPHEHTALWKHFSVRPSGPWTEPDGGSCLNDLCVPMKATKTYLYTDAWVAKIIRTVGTAQKYTSFFGHSPTSSQSHAA